MKRTLLLITSAMLCLLISGIGLGRGTATISRVFLDKEDCRGMATPDSMLCDTNGCAAIARKWGTGKTGPGAYKMLNSADEFAMYDNKLDECFSAECRAVVSRDASIPLIMVCDYNPNCVAIVKRTPSMCTSEAEVLATKKAWKELAGKAKVGYEGMYRDIRETLKVFDAKTSSCIGKIASGTSVVKKS